MKTNGTILILALIPRTLTSIAVRTHWELRAGRHGVTLLGAEQAGIAPASAAPSKPPASVVRGILCFVLSLEFADAIWKGPIATSFSALSC